MTYATKQIGKFDKMLLKERAKNLPRGGGQGVVA
jgi:hypothetical protein